MSLFDGLGGGFFGGFGDEMGRRAAQEVLGKADAAMEKLENDKAERESYVGKRVSLKANKTYRAKNGEEVPKAIVNMPNAFKVLSCNGRKFTLSGKYSGKEYIVVVDCNEVMK